MLNLNIPPWKLFRWFRRVQLWATGDWQLHHNNVPAHASRLMWSFLEKYQSPRWLSPLQPRFGALWLLAFPKTKITFEREDISDSWWDSGNIWWGSWWWLGELCEVPSCLLWRGTETSLSYVHCFLYLVSSSINISVFHIHILQGYKSFMRFIQKKSSHW